jgi:hypothetical protein
MFPPDLMAHLARETCVSVPWEDASWKLSSRDPRWIICLHPTELTHDPRGSRQPARKITSQFARQTPAMPSRTCHAIGNYKTHSACGEPVWAGADGRAVCEEHNHRAVDDEPQCQAFQIKYPSLRCPNKARGGRIKFCMHQHAGLYIDPGDFRKRYLRSTTRNAKATADKQENIDVYLGNDMAADCWEDTESYELDHVVECEVVAAVFSKLKFPNARAETKCRAILFEATNDPDNLRLTATWANQVKMVAVSSFLDDWVLKKGGPKPFAHYVAEAEKGGWRFDARQVRRVCKEVKRALQQFRKAAKAKKSKLPEDLWIQLNEQLVALYKAHQFSEEIPRRHSRGSVTPFLSIGRRHSNPSSPSKTSSKARVKTPTSSRSEVQPTQGNRRKTPRRRTASASGATN